VRFITSKLFTSYGSLIVDSRGLEPEERRLSRRFGATACMQDTLINHSLVFEIMSKTLTCIALTLKSSIEPFLGVK
jgi:hypothetical protein